MKELLQREIANYEELQVLMEEIIFHMERIDDLIFQQTQTIDPYSEQNQKLQSLGTTCNSCNAIFTYIAQYEDSKKTKFDFHRVKVAVRKLIKVLIDVERVFHMEIANQRAMSNVIYS